MADPFDTPGYRYSVNRFPGDGATTTWNISFAGMSGSYAGYISTAHVKAYTIEDATGAETPLPIPSTAWIGPTTLKIEPAVAAGHTLVVYRDTPKNAPLLDYVDGALIIEKNLDTSNQQAVYAVAEMVDRFADAMEDMEAFTLALLDKMAKVEGVSNDAHGIAVEARNTANSAAAQAAAAVQTSQDALAGVGGATQAAIDATAAANSANTAAGLATTAANNANQAATDALATAAQAVNTANNAHSIAVGIDSKAQSALDASAAAVATANGVDGKAQSALDASAAATSTANSADSKADAAVSTANGVDAKAQQGIDAAAAAQTTANSAVSDAAAAQTTANSALGYVLPVIQSSYFWSPGREGSCFIKTAAGAISIKAGTVLIANGTVHKFTTNTAVSMPTLTAGTDYDVWVRPDGTAVAAATSYASPSTTPVAGSVLIGGFHYGLVAPGTTVASGGFSTSGVIATGGSMAWTQDDVDRLAGINEFSLWSLDWRCVGEQFGMTLDPQTRYFNAIYFCSTDHEVSGISAAGTNIASGTVLPKVPTKFGGNGTLAYSRCDYFTALEVALSHGLELYNYTLSCSGFFGVTEGTSLGGASSTVPATVRQPGFTSRIGVEQATGHQWVVGGPLHSVGGSAYADTGRGSFYGTSGLPLFGGSRTDSSNSGSRVADFSNSPVYSGWNLSVRAVGCLIDNKGRGIAF